MPTLTFRDSLAQFFRDRPGQWIDGMVLANVGGCYAYRTRISDLRTQLGMQIDNRQRRVGRRVVANIGTCRRSRRGRASDDPWSLASRL